MILGFRKPRPGAILLNLLLLLGVGHNLDTEGYRSFSFSCLTPLLDQVDKEKQPPSPSPSCMDNRIVLLHTRILAGSTFPLLQPLHRLWNGSTG